MFIFVLHSERNYGTMSAGRAWKMKHNVLISFSFQDHAQPQGDLRYDLYGVEYIDATVPSIFPAEQRLHFKYLRNAC